MCILLASRDLLLLSRTQGAANKLGVTLLNASDPMGACSLVEKNECRGVIIDLRLPSLQIADLVPRLRELGSNKLVIIACGPHVHEGSLTAARVAGCDLVVTRGQFEHDAEEILRRCLLSEEKLP